MKQVTQSYEKMVLIPGGEFQMGSNDVESEPDTPPIGWPEWEYLLMREASHDEQPVHIVNVRPFYMDIYPVTNAQYKMFIDANPEWRKDWIAKEDTLYLNRWKDNNYPILEANHPVRYINWYAAMAYAEWVGKRLPTEAEWEKAARGGLVGMQYPWGDTRDSTLANAYVYEERIGCYVVYHHGDVLVNYTKPAWLQKLKKHLKKRTNNTETTEVGSYPANGYGLYDMVGNGKQWCIDSYDVDFYSKSPQDNPLNLGTEFESYENTIDNINLILNDYKNLKAARVQRGGKPAYRIPFVRVARRRHAWPSGDYGGFRCAMSVTP